MPWTTLIALDELTDGEARPVDIDGYRLAIFFSAGQAYVLDDACPHAGASMSGGWVQDGCAVCPKHLWRFDLATGHITATGGEGLRTYPTRTREHNGRVFLQAELAMP